MTFHWVSAGTKIAVFMFSSDRTRYSSRSDVGPRFTDPAFGRSFTRETDVIESLAYEDELHNTRRARSDLPQEHCQANCGAASPHGFPPSSAFFNSRSVPLNEPAQQASASTMTTTAIQPATMYVPSLYRVFVISHAPRAVLDLLIATVSSLP